MLDAKPSAGTVRILVVDSDDDTRESGAKRCFRMNALLLKRPMVGKR